MGTIVRVAPLSRVGILDSSQVVGRIVGQRSDAVGRIGQRRDQSAGAVGERHRLTIEVGNSCQLIAGVVGEGCRIIVAVNQGGFTAGREKVVLRAVGHGPGVGVVLVLGQSREIPRRGIEGSLRLAVGEPQAEAAA